MNSRHLLILSGIIMGSLTLAGCGVTGHLTATPTGHGNYAVSGTVHTSGAVSARSSSTPPSSSTTPSSHALAPTSSSTTTPSSTAPSQVAKLTVTAQPNPITPQQPTTISGTVYLSNGQGAPHAKMTILGLPQDPKGETIYTNASGQYHITAQWSQPGTYLVSVGNGMVGWQTHVVVDASSSSQAATSTPLFVGHQVQRYIGRQTPQALPNGFRSASSHDTFSAQVYHPVEGFGGLLDGHPFVLDFYQDSSVGIFVGASYNGQPTYFGPGPAPMFDVLNFTGTDVVLGMPSAGAYMALNLVTGHPIVSTREVVALKGYSGLTAPSHILGLPTTTYSIDIPYGTNP